MRLSHLSTERVATRSGPMFWTWLVVASVLFTTQVHARSAVPVEGFADLVDQVKPAVVNISTTTAIAPSNQESGPDLPQFPPGSPFEEFFKEFFDREQNGRNDRPRPSSSLGSGFVIDPRGFVVTNNHVIGEADEITVTFNDETSYEAELIGRDQKTDLALLKIERDDPFPYVEFGDSSQVRVGDWVMAIGNPFGLGSTVTAGIISARGRDIRAGPYDDFIQVDAAINRGNSGGPSFDMDGKVIGVNTAIFSPSGGNVGIGFAIPSNIAASIIDSLRNDGTVRRGWLGVRIQAVNEDIAEGLGMPEARGALVASISPGGPASGADIKPGDVILSFAGRDVDRMRSLPRIVAETPINQTVDVEIWRDGALKTVEVVTGELPDDAAIASLERGDSESSSTPQLMTIDELGIDVAPIDEATIEAFSLPEGVKGVVVAEVDADVRGGDDSLLPGDVISEVNQEEVNSPPELMAKIQEASRTDRKLALMLVNRGGDLRFVAVPLTTE